MRRSLLRRLRDWDESGITLLELLISISLGAILVGALTVALITSLRTIGATGVRYTESHDAQLATTYFASDASSTSSSGLSTTNTVTCADPSDHAAASTIASFEWSDANANSITSDWLIEGTRLIRRYCHNSRLQSSLTMGRDIARRSPRPRPPQEPIPTGQRP